ncbi:hypothetical protein RFI_25751 [Reticulomyxa filosa]|uniref:Uncharacterized protein n=1 Tax=Reticulomyxa filosa TaxID=46433 RepID=X6MEZ5_RETFI|nr:hypothetical protein RFI_25751 [Reticulomyxa filosa]|eukprot:ETO11625.1 hypothetical protein RFI_25751 [Reticulomyxa filosa]
MYCKKKNYFFLKLLYFKNLLQVMNVANLFIDLYKIINKKNNFTYFHLMKQFLLCNKQVILLQLKDLHKNKHFHHANKLLQYIPMNVYYFKIMDSILTMTQKYWIVEQIANNFEFKFYILHYNLMKNGDLLI